MEQAQSVSPWILVPGSPVPQTQDCWVSIPTRWRMEWCHQPGCAGSLTRGDFFCFFFHRFYLNWAQIQKALGSATVVAQCIYIKLILSDVQGDCYEPPAWCIWTHRSPSAMGDQRCPSLSLAQLSNSKHMHLWDEHSDSPINGTRGMLTVVSMLHLSTGCTVHHTQQFQLSGLPILLRARSHKMQLIQAT